VAKPTVYLETSFVSYLTSRPSRDLVRAGRQQITREWWNQRHGFESYISALVLSEAREGDPIAAQERLAALAGLPVLPVNEAANSLASTLVDQGAIPKEFVEDALHVALATIHGMQYLLTWNFRHLNNARLKTKLIRTVNDFGLECPTICSPEELSGDTTWS